MNRKNCQLIYRTKRHIHDVINTLVPNCVDADKLNSGDRRMYESLVKALECLKKID